MVICTHMHTPYIPLSFSTQGMEEKPVTIGWLPRLKFELLTHQMKKHERKGLEEVEPLLLRFSGHGEAMTACRVSNGKLDVSALVTPAANLFLALIMPLNSYIHLC